MIAIDGERTIDQTESAKRFVARDGMQALTRRMGDGIDLRLGAAVASIGRRGSSWEVRDAAGATRHPTHARSAIRPGAAAACASHGR